MALVLRREGLWRRLTGARLGGERQAGRRPRIETRGRQQAQQGTSDEQKSVATHAFWYGNEAPHS